ncbi:NTP transferase domain-containing protein [Bacteriovorax sp. Seq25_V]|uniref:nucleotidyltransferase family protein n=1 Tax=Bacteriovorax sp. Seq25_V TaxID=1201288 RepID=UPI00038A4A7C|nr:NTP transferase domain-containing protein [Bacteriovorax sp. Seq25_V]EQC43462.1 MobA-like NTP transferase domain protein [Bacteriovorax sp. Seq25_V]
MQIDNCLITAAGLGTRMGVIGEKLPKPLWPVFDTTLLDLQLEYVKRFHAKRIFVNAYHNSEKIIEWSKNKDITVLVEDDLLGSGGCIHNLKASSEVVGPITAVVNSDQFFLLSEEQIEEGLDLVRSGNDSVIYGMLVNKNEKYNETICDNNRLIGIEKPKGDKDYYTFSGVSIINLDRLDYKEGASGFFDSVCNYRKNSQIYFFNKTSDVKFWDYGTKEKYVENIFNVINSDTEMERIIQNIGIDLNNYNIDDGILRFDLYDTCIDRLKHTIEIESIIDQI